MTAPNQPVIDPDRFDAVIFDLDGVVTRTATQHACAWQNAFDALSERLRHRGAGAFPPFDPRADYLAHVDGRPRLEGAASFLRARNVNLPPGAPDDQPGLDSVAAVANLKNELFQALIRTEGVEIYEDTVRLLRHWRSRGIRTAIASSSRNSEQVLRAADLLDHFDIRCDGRDLAELNLPGKPAPDLFLETARRLGVEPARAAVIEDAEAGVQAAAAGKFALVIGIDRAAPGEDAPDLAARGAHIVCATLADLPDHSQTNDGPHS